MTIPPRTEDRGRLTAAAVAAAIAAAVVGSVVAIASDRGTSMFADMLSVAFVVVVIAVVGAIVTLAVPGNRVGWLLLAAAAVLGIGLAFTEAGIRGVLTEPGSVPGAAYLAALGGGLEAAGMLLAVVGVPVVFPDGHLPGPRWRWLAWAAVAGVIFLFLSNVLAPHTQETRLANWDSPLGLPARYANVVNVFAVGGVLFAVAAAAGAIAGLVIRWRRGGPLVRQQLLFLALATVPPALVFLAILADITIPPWVFGVVLLPLPVAIAIAILNHGLYDLRRAAYRTLVWVTMSAVVVGIYAAVVITIAALVPDHHAWWPSAVAAALAALVLIPLRDKLQRGVTRVVYGRWHEPYEILAGLGERLEAAADMDRLLDAVVAELSTGLDLRDVSVRGLDGTVVTGTGEAAGTAAAAVSGFDTGLVPGMAAGAGAGTASIPLLAYGTAVGSLTYRKPDRQLSAAGERLLHDLARQLGSALHARLLREDLQRARERLVLAREEERRRLRRDLHDGIGPALAGLTLKTETARAMLPPGTDGAARQLRDLSEEIRRTVIDVRHLVEGLRPPALDELGLAGACTQAVERLTSGSGVVASVDAAGDLPALPAAVEVAAYRIVVEAVTNTVRHARARNCRVSITRTPAGLDIEIADDGTGLAAAAHHGHGLAIMRERAEELGGTVTVRDGSPGVAVQARLPAAAAPAQVPPVPAVPAQAPPVPAVPA